MKRFRAHSALLAVAALAVAATAATAATSAAPPLKNGGTLTIGLASDPDALDPTLPRSTRASEISPVTSVDARGRYTVVLHLNERFSPLTAQLADRAGMVMSPKALDDLGDRFATNPVCVGPFMYKERQAGDHITLVKSPHYYGRKNVHLDSVVFKIITDPSARSQNLRSHDIDVEDRIPSTELRGIASDRSL